MTIATVIMAAGKGTRMKSDLPKVLHKVGGRTLIEHALALASAVSDLTPLVVVGHGADAVQAVVGERADCVLQTEQLGTGHAVLQAHAALAGKADWVLVWAADMPLFHTDTLRRVADAQSKNSGALTLLTVQVQDPRNFGRIVRDESGNVLAIVEEALCTPEQATIREVNPGLYCFSADWLWTHLPKLKISPKGEYFLTDLLAMAVEQGQRVVAVSTPNEIECIGINTRVHLAEAETAMRERTNRYWMEQGVTIQDPNSTYIDVTAQIGIDTIIYPNTHIQGNSSIGTGCAIGPNTIIYRSQVGNACKVFSSVVEEARLENNVQIGPFGHLRKGAHLADGVYLGNFGEVKNSYLGTDVKMGHFSYVGDATIGARTNIAAGTITCNFGADHKKHRTEIGEDVFIGSDTMLVAPLTLGDRARTGAGSVVTKDVPADSLAVGVPARILKKRT
jgi:bifunctional UDP-N-acetylglucosamine pyrophosphorylase/glucosamine-1-phosphate N-acetyltransferase